MAKSPTDDKRWTEVDRYLTDLVVNPGAALTAAIESNRAAGLPGIDVTAAQGKLLHLLALSINARRILEIGTLGGYSTLWLAQALTEDGRLITLESEPDHAKVARANFARAKLDEKIELRLGPALDSLAKLKAEGAEPFDFIFIDADKAPMADYFKRSLALSRRGSLIVADNVVRKGAVVDPASPEASVQGVRRFFDLLSKERRVQATVIQTVGSKGYDGFALAVVL